MLIDTTGCGCGQSTIAVTPPTCQKCRTPLTMTNIQELVWLQGLDEDLCVAFQRVSDVLGLRDCAGNRISQETPIVTCEDFKAQLCAALAGLAAGGEAVPESTLLVGADCKLYTIPPSGVVPSETPNTVTDTPTVNLSATGTLGRNISAAVVVSPQSGNDLVALADGLFVDASAAGPTACQQIQTFPTGAPAVPGTFLVGADCQVHQVPAADPITVSDTSSINLTLIGQNIAADLILSPDSIGAITGDGLEITCADVLNCAPAVTVVDSPTVDLTINSQEIRADVKVSGTAGNDLTVDAFGLYVSVCDRLAVLPSNGNAVPDQTLLVGSDCQTYTLPEAALTAVGDTQTLDLSLLAGVLTGNVVVAPGQLIQATAQGISLTCEQVQDCAFGVTNNFWEYNDAANQVLFNPSDDAGNTLVLGTDQRPFVAPVVVTVTDTDCINLTATDNDITASIVLSAQPNNGLLCLADGLFSPQSDVIVSGGETDCIITQVVEAPVGTFTVTATPVISADVGNAIECRPDGLYAPEGSTVLADDGNCIDVTVTELPAGTYTVGAELIVSPDLNNAIECRGNGVYAPLVDVVAGLPNACVDLSVTELPAGTFTIDSSLNLSAFGPGGVGCNGLSCEVDGLTSPSQITGFLDRTLPTNVSTTILAGVVDSEVFGETNLAFSNVSPCRSQTYTLISSGEPRIVFEMIDPTLATDVNAVLYVETSQDNGATWQRRGSITARLAYAAHTGGFEGWDVTGIFTTSQVTTLAFGGGEFFRVRYTADVLSATNTGNIDFSVSNSQLEIIGHTI